jgi:hypothetical protein
VKTRWRPWLAGGALLLCTPACERTPRDAEGLPGGYFEEQPQVEPAQLMVLTRAEEPSGGAGHRLVEVLLTEGRSEREVHAGLQQLSDEELAADDVIAVRIIVFAAVAQRPGEATLVPIAYGQAGPITGWGTRPRGDTPTRLYVYFGPAPPW